MLEIFRRLFDTAGFPARWRCGTWSPELGWLHVASDTAIWGAYTAIPIVLAILVWRRRDVPFPRIFWLFCAFIYTCGIGHLVEAAIFWYPVYRLSGVIKAVTAVVSWLTVAALIPVVPRALTLPRLAKVNVQLEQEMAQRRDAESALKSKATELAHINEELERFNRLASGREQRMIELKRQVNELCAELGRPAPHRLDFLGPAAKES